MVVQSGWYNNRVIRIMWDTPTFDILLSFACVTPGDITKFINGGDSISHTVHYRKSTRITLTIIELLTGYIQSRLINHVLVD